MMIPLTSPEIAEGLLAGIEPLWIFKHSNSCPVSLAAHDEVLEFLAAHAMPVGIVTVQEARAVSNWLATRLAYVHQSPQLFLVVAGKVVWHASHWGITAKAMTAAIGTQRK